MHTSFPAWYRLSGLKPDPDTIERRTKVLDIQGPKLNTGQILKHAGFFLGKQELPKEDRDELSAQFQTADPSFIGVDNTLELRILSGALLVNAIEASKPTRSLIAAMSIDCGKFGCAPKKMLIPEVTIIAGDWLRVRAALQRKGLDLDNAQVVPFKADNFADPNLWGPSAREFSKVAAQAINNLESRMLVLAEESNFLWWMTTEYSEVLHKEFSAIDLETLAIVASKELADLTQLLPGPTSSDAVLSRVLGTRKTKNKIDLIRVINSVPRQWRKTFAETIGENGVSSLLPISLGIVKSLDTDDIDGWIPVYKKASGLSRIESISVPEVGIQFYKECLLRRAMEEAK